MTIQEISLLVSLIATGLGLLGTIFAYIKRIVKDIKTKKLHAFIEREMAKAESEGNLNGATKLLYVLNSLYTEYGREYAHIEEEAKKYIEECIDFSKKINSNK